MRRELLKGSHQDAQRASEPIVFPNQDAIETPAARIFHQLAIGPVVLALGSAPLHVAADVIDVLLIYREPASGRVFARKANNCASGFCSPVETRA